MSITSLSIPCWSSLSARSASAISPVTRAMISVYGMNLLVHALAGQPFGTPQIELWERLSKPVGWLVSASRLMAVNKLVSHLAHRRHLRTHPGALALSER